MQIGGVHQISRTKYEMPPGEGGKTLSARRAPIDEVDSNGEPH